MNPASPESTLLPSPAGRSRRWRAWMIALTLTGLLTFVLVPQVQRAFGLLDYGRWFLDTYAILATSDAVHLGIDPTAPNPLDPLHRPHSYSHWWFGLHGLGLTRADNFLVGGLWLTAFLLVAFATVRPRSAGEAAWNALLLLSPPVLLAIMRGNNDLVVFGLLGVAGLGVARGRNWSLTAAACAIAAATGLKFYPAVALGVFGLVRPRRRLIVATALAALLLAVVAADVGGDLRKAVILTPPVGPYNFGAGILLRDLGWNNLAGKLGSIGVALAAAIWLVRRGWVRWTVRTADGATERAMFLLGAALLAGCFFAGMSYGYRWVFAIWVSPWLWRQARREAGPGMPRTLAGLACALLFVGVWGDGLLATVINVILPPVPLPDLLEGLQVWRLFTEPLTWLLMTLLIGWLGAAWLEAWRTLRGEASAGAQPVSTGVGLRPDDEAALRRVRGGMVALGLALVVLVAEHSPGIWSWLGVGTAKPPFVDTYGYLAGAQVAAHGGDAYASNPLDPFGRGHVYGTVWLWLGRLGLGVRHAPLFGWTSVFALVGMLGLLLRPPTWRWTALAAIWALSPCVLLAAERGNNDLLVIAGCALAAWLAAREATAAKCGAVALAALAAAAKYYPAALLPLFVLAARDHAQGWRLAGVTTGALGVLAWLWIGDPVLAGARWPADTGLDIFGLPAFLGWAGMTHVRASIVSLVALVALAGLVAWFGRRRQLWQPGADAAEVGWAVVALAVIVASYFTACNFLYRLTWLVLALPLAMRAPDFLTPTGGVAMRLWTIAATVSLVCFSTPVLWALGSALWGEPVGGRLVHYLAIGFQIAGMILVGASVALLVDFVRGRMRRLWSPAD